MKKILTLLLCVTLLLGLCPVSVYAAPEWPSNVSIEAEGGIVIDANSGAVLYGKNMHVTYFPASITKILTALIVIENCDLNDIVTFSHNAVYNVESGSSNAGLDEGDQLTVQQCLYAMLLRSANEAANALAEHTAGSIEAFSVMMNAKAQELGCTDSNFCNPSGLNDPNHYTTAYDMALISKAAFENDIFVEIDSTTYYDLPVTKQNPEGLRIYPGHRMMKKNMSEYYDGIIGGKTGYTTLAGNTLVTCAERNGMKLITVVLNGHQSHYRDTRAMLNFGYENFKSLKIGDYDTTYSSIDNDLSIAGLPTANLASLSIEKNRTITLPNDGEFTDCDSTISYTLPAYAPETAVAQISYSYNDRNIGYTYLTAIDTSAVAASLVDVTTEAPETLAVPAETAELPSGETAAPEESEREPFRIPSAVWITLIVLVVLAALVGGGILLKAHIERREEKERLARYHRRQQRLQDIGVSSSEFDLMLEQRRKSYSLSDKSPRRRRGRKRHL